MAGRRLQTGGRIDRSKRLHLRFDDISLEAYPGDTLASALLAAGERIVGRSFKYHRPRGIYTAGAEEPNALVHLRSGGRQEPNTRATQIEAFDGLTASGQNGYPHVRFDLMAINDVMSPFFTAGFYYKTFIGPFSGTKFWMFCEKFIRRAAGMGRVEIVDDPDCYEKLNAFCDLLVVGAGPSGLAAALTAARAGADVILVDQDFALGGSLLSQPGDGAIDAWVAEIRKELEAAPNVRVLTRTTAFGAYDGDVYGLVERVSDHLAAPENHQPRQRYWQVRTRQAVFATGAIERPMVFGGNDLPGVMLASAMQTYVNRFAVLPGERIVLAANNDTAYQVARDLAAAGAKVTLCDVRTNIPAKVVSSLQAVGIEVLPGTGVIRAIGCAKVRGARIVPLDDVGRACGESKKLTCDAIGISAGWMPVVHLWSQIFKKPRFDPTVGAFLPAEASRGTVHCAGRMMAAQSLSERISSGVSAARAALAALSLTPQARGIVGPGMTLDTGWARGLSSIWCVTDALGKPSGKAFVDLQHDVKVGDVDQAHLEGFVSIEHLKRYTTTGMAADQGKTSNVNALARMAELSGRSIPDVGTTTFRPPYTPVAIGAIVGHESGRHLRPTRLSTMHDLHVEAGAKLTDAGYWVRPWYYPEAGEDVKAAYIREAKHVRAHVGMVDVSTLGKVAVQGPDAAQFLDRIYTNVMSTLKIGQLRYGVMLREDGIVLDDGAVARVGENDYFMSTTTANAARVLAMCEQLLQTEWPDLRVHVTSISDQWAAIAVAGPKSRDLLAAAVSGADVSAAALPNNRFVTASIGGVEVRIHRMSYSGELAYEIYIPSGFGPHVWRALADAGKAFALKPYGTESMGALRIEKGHVAGAEIDGRTTMKDLGIEGFASKKKPFIGSVLKNRPVLADPARPTLVGLEIVGNEGAQAGSLIFAAGVALKGHGEGWVSSTTYSPTLGRYIALALVKNGRGRMGEEVVVANFLADKMLRAKIVSHHFFDPDGSRQNA